MIFFFKLHNSPFGQFTRRFEGLNLKAIPLYILCPKSLDTALLDSLILGYKDYYFPLLNFSNNFTGFKTLGI